MSSQLRHGLCNGIFLAKTGFCFSVRTSRNQLAFLLPVGIFNYADLYMLSYYAFQLEIQTTAPPGFRLKNYEQRITHFAKVHFRLHSNMYSRPSPWNGPMPTLRRLSDVEYQSMGKLGDFFLSCLVYMYVIYYICPYMPKCSQDQPGKATIVQHKQIPFKHICVLQRS